MFAHCTYPSKMLAVPQIVIMNNQTEFWHWLNLSPQ